MDIQQLTNIGLNEQEAHVYSSLLQYTDAPAGTLIEKTGIKRGTVYNTLESLKQRGLVEELPDTKVARFKARHPGFLYEVVDQKEKELETVKGSLQQLVEQYNLTNHKPGIRFYEGKQGIWKVLEDSLTASDEICAFGDIEAIVKYIDDINSKYVHQRQKKGIKKRGFMLDTPFAREYLKNYFKDVTDTKLIKYDAPPFQNVMQIYDNKISYITLSDKFLLGVIINDKFIYQMHKYLFNYLWQITPNIMA